MNDPIYKRIFGFPRMVEDLLRGFAKGDWVARADFSALRKAPAEYIGDDLRKRLGDSVWRLPLDEGWLHVFVLLEFQSRNERGMALRILEYTLMLHQELARGRLGPDGRHPPVLPIVLYNGRPRWSAATNVRDLIAPAGRSLAPYQPSQRYLVVDLQRLGEDDLSLRNLVGAVSRMERSRTPDDLRLVAVLLQEWLRGPKNTELRRAFADWLWYLAQLLQLGTAAAGSPPKGLDLEDVRMNLDEMSLAERVARWPKPWLRKGQEPEPERSYNEGLRKSFWEGRAEGVQEGFAQQRALLHRQAALRFGVDVAERAADRLEHVRDRDRFEEIGELILRCKTGSEFLARLDD